MKIRDPSDTLVDLVVEQTVIKLIETAERLVAKRNVTGSGVTSAYGTFDNTSKVWRKRVVLPRRNQQRPQKSLTGRQEGKGNAYEENFPRI